MYWNALRYAFFQTYQLGSSNSTLKGFVWSWVTVRISATTWDDSKMGSVVDDSESFFASSSFLLRRNIFSADVFGQDKIPFLSVQQSALEWQKSVLPQAFKNDQRGSWNPYDSFVNHVETLFLSVQQRVVEWQDQLVLIKVMKKVQLKHQAYRKTENNNF